jgi:hypothetical protein
MSMATLTLPLPRGGQQGDPAQEARYSDQAAFLGIVLRRGACDATGAALNYRQAIVTTEVSTGVHRLIVVTAAHWDAGIGPMSSGDPHTDTDILDGRLLFATDTDRAMVPGYVRSYQELP